VDDDCFAARLAAAYKRRFGERASAHAARRLTRALRCKDIIKTDLFVAVGVILRDKGGQFRASRACSERLVLPLGDVGAEHAAPISLRGLLQQRL
jgi:hypothetical protein